MSATAESVSWHERARRLEFRTQAFIDGRYADAASGATFDCINPATGKLLARVAAGDSEDINRAVTSARAAFRKGSWANLAPAKRKKVLLRFADLIRERGEELPGRGVDAIEGGAGGGVHVAAVDEGLRAELEPAGALVPGNRFSCCAHDFRAPLFRRLRGCRH